MAKDDYHVIVYQVLAYLYVQLKSGAPVDPELLKPNSKYLGINATYWAYVMENLQAQGFISGLSITKAWGDVKLIDGLESCQITPQGIEYLCNDSFLSKAKEFLRDIKAIVPFI